MFQDIWVMGEAMCKLVPFIGEHFYHHCCHLPCLSMARHSNWLILELTVSHTSVLTILAITVERYYAVGF